MARNCGPCSLCCTTLGVAEIEKPPRVRCDHLKLGRCGIYADRPSSCRDFECLWLQGVLPNELRPDKVKAVFGLNTTGDIIIIITILPRPRGAHRKGALAAWIAGCKNISIIVVCGDDRHAFGPIAAQADVQLASYDTPNGPPTLVQITPKEKS